jgi:hypothetical protein
MVLHSPWHASLPSAVVTAKVGTRLLLSLAAWRALFQLVHDPQRWEKTEHGLAKTSRLAESDRY